MKPNNTQRQTECCICHFSTYNNHLIIKTDLIKLDGTLLNLRKGESRMKPTKAEKYKDLAIFLAGILLGWTIGYLWIWSLI